MSPVHDVRPLGQTIDDPIGHPRQGENSLMISDPFGDKDAEESVAILKKPQGSFDGTKDNHDPLVRMDAGEIPLHESLVHLDLVRPSDARGVDEHQVELAVGLGSSMNLPKVESVASISDGSEVTFSGPTPVSGNDIRDGPGTSGEVQNTGNVRSPVLLQEADDELDDLHRSGLQVGSHPVRGLGTSRGVLAVDAPPRQAGFGDTRLTTTVEKAANEASPLHFVDHMPDESEGLLSAVGRECSVVGDSDLDRLDGDPGCWTGLVQPHAVVPPEQPHLDLADALHAVHGHVDRQDSGPDCGGQ